MSIVTVAIDAQLHETTRSHASLGCCGASREVVPAVRAVPLGAVGDLEAALAPLGCNGPSGPLATK